jgi:hypothetical protein
MLCLISAHMACCPYELLDHSFTTEPADAVKVSPESSIIKLVLTKASKQLFKQQCRIWLPSHSTKGDNLSGIIAHHHGGKPLYKYETLVNFVKGGPSEKKAHFYF